MSNDEAAWRPIQYADPAHVGLYALWTASGLTWGRYDAPAGGWVDWRGQPIEPAVFLPDPEPPFVLGMLTPEQDRAAREEHGAVL